MPTEEDLATLPIIDITPDGVWVPSAYNETDRGLSFQDPIFDPPVMAQLMTSSEPIADPICTTAMPSLQPNESPTPAPEIFHDASEHPPIPTEIFHDAPNDLFPDGGHFFDPSDGDDSPGFIGKAFHLTLSGETAIDSVDVDHFLMTLDHAELRGDHEPFDSFAYASRAAIQD
jgi:hypothetical protein